jgi:hypothetical protein
VGGNDGNAVGLALPPGIGGLFGAVKEGGGGAAGLLKRKSGTVMTVKPTAPKRKQLHWDMLENVEGTIWRDLKDKDNVDELVRVVVSAYITAYSTQTHKHINTLPPSLTPSLTHSIC